MSEFHVKVGTEVSFAKTVSESDVYAFAGISGDFAPNHVNAQYMQQSRYGQRIAHGALIIGYMSTAATRLISCCDSPGETPVSLGYDRIRFTAPVFFGDTVTVRYKVKSIDARRRRSIAEIVVENQNGKVVALAEHILKWVPDN